MNQPKPHKTHLDLPLEIREQMIAALNQHLADTFDLYSQTKQAHWNVRDAAFFQLHELFDKLADEVEEYVDLIAERVTTLGGTALGTVRMAAAASRLDEYPRDVSRGLTSVEALAVAYAALAQTTREAIEAAALPEMPPPPTFSPKLRAASTNRCGFSTHICRRVGIH